MTSEIRVCPRNIFGHGHRRYPGREAELARRAGEKIGEIGTVNHLPEKQEAKKVKKPVEIATWTGLGLSPGLAQEVENAGFLEPTAIQQRAIPIALSGGDLIASARTGSGKTAAFALPMIEKFQDRRGTFGLILCPTREIALQTLETLERFGKPLGMRSIALIGGTDVKADEASLRQVPNIIVGTPGRICDHIDRGNLWLEFIEVLVLDEADRMLDMGFSKELGRITAEIQKERQTWLFSATIPVTIEKLCREILRNPERITIGKALSVSQNVEHEILWVNEESKKRELIRLVKREPGSIIVFSRTKDGATRLWHWIHAAGIYESTYISSNKAQSYREEALEGFKTGKYRVLVATDVAGRGIHVENVSYVINFDMPMEPEDYIHRIGRTGRKDQKGRAISFVTPRDLEKLQAIEHLLNNRIPESWARDFVDERPKRLSRGEPRSGGGGRGGGRGGGGGGRSRDSSRSSSSRSSSSSSSSRKPRRR